jgi:molecular chaperone GrpE
MSETNETINQEAESGQDEQTVELTEDLSAAEAIFDESNPAEASAKDPAEEYKKEIDELKAKLEQADNRYLRLQADFDNYRRRQKIEMEANEKYRAQKLVEDLLPAVDNFERALKMEVENEQTKSLLQGMEMVYRGLIDALKKEGVEPIEAAGKEFDPRLHHAVMQAADENYAANTVVEEFQKGYMLKDRVIRPAMVKVNQ